MAFERGWFSNRRRARDAEIQQISEFLAAGGGDRAVTSAYEDWCDEHGVRPEAVGVWEAYEASRAPLNDPPER